MVEYPQYPEEELATLRPYLNDQAERVLEWVHTCVGRIGVGEVLREGGFFEEPWTDPNARMAKGAGGAEVFALEINSQARLIKELLEGDDEIDLDELSRYAAMVGTAAASRVLGEHWAPEVVASFVDELVDELCADSLSSGWRRELVDLDEARMRRSLAKMANGRNDTGTAFMRGWCVYVGADRAVEVLDELSAGTGPTEFICTFAFWFAGQGRPIDFFRLSGYGAQLVARIYSWLQTVVLPSAAAAMNERT